MTMLARRPYDGARVDVLMEMERHTVGTSKEVCSALPAHWSCGSRPSVPVSLRRDETDRGVVQPLLVPVVVGLDGPIWSAGTSWSLHIILRGLILPLTLHILEYKIPFNQVSRFGDFATAVADGSEAVSEQLRPSWWQSSPMTTASTDRA